MSLILHPHLRFGFASFKDRKLIYFTLYLRIFLFVSLANYLKYVFGNSETYEFPFCVTLTQIRVNWDLTKLKTLFLDPDIIVFGISQSFLDEQRLFYNHNLNL